jgi:hypothetical protein
MAGGRRAGVLRPALRRRRQRLARQTPAFVLLEDGRLAEQRDSRDQSSQRGLSRDLVAFGQVD